MKRIILGLSLATLFINTSCKKCKSCSYTYSKTSIVQGINGEETISETLIGYVVDSDGQQLKQECIKSSESYTINVAYDLEKENTTLDDFEITCVDS
jgi:hypothetical protein